jgi:hypothetical protein
MVFRCQHGIGILLGLRRGLQDWAVYTSGQLLDNRESVPSVLIRVDDASKAARTSKSTPIPAHARRVERGWLRKALRPGGSKSSKWRSLVLTALCSACSLTW